MTTSYHNCKMDETITGESGNYLDVFASSNFLKEGLMKFVNFFFPISLRALVFVFFFAGFSLVQAENLKMSVMIEHDHNDSENMIKLVPKVIRVKQSDRVTLNIKTMQNGIMHIHGYDIENEVKKGELGDLHFEANATGRFKITFHAKEEHAHKKRNKNMEDMRQKATILKGLQTMPLSIKKKLRLVTEIMGIIRSMKKRNKQLDILRFIPISIHTVYSSVYKYAVNS